MNNINRWFVRCEGCLMIAAVETLPIWGTVCGLCGSTVENMGRVERGRLVHDHTQSACDDRCTYARGPHCDCKCGGENHGSKRVVTFTTDAGAVPVLRVADDAKAKAVAAEFREAVNRTLVQLDALRGRRRSGEFLPYDDFRRLLTLERTLVDARKARSHAGRMRKLQAVLASAA